MLHSHDATVTESDEQRPNRGGRPVHPSIIAVEALVESLAAIDCDAEAFERAAHANVQIARVIHERALRLRDAIRPEIQRGYEAAERIVATRRTTTETVEVTVAA